MNAWPLLGVLGVLSLGLRSTLVVAADRFPLPDRLRRWCELLGPAILAALLGASIVTPLSDGAVVAELVPLTVGATVGALTRSTVATLAAGLGAHVVLLAVS